MKLLETEIISPKGFRGFTFRKVYENDDYYIYEQIKTESGITYGYQSFRRRINKLFNVEAFPGPNAPLAWQHGTLEQAKNKIEHEQKRIRKPN